MAICPPALSFIVRLALAFQGAAQAFQAQIGVAADFDASGALDLDAALGFDGQVTQDLNLSELSGECSTILSGRSYRRW